MTLTVRRIQVGQDSRLEPACDYRWPVIDQLRWWAAVVRLDSGNEDLILDVQPADYYIDNMKQDDFYDVVGSDWSAGPMSSSKTWTYLSGLSQGLRLVGSDA